MHSSSQWTENDDRRVLQKVGRESISTSAGIALSGGLIFNAIDGNNLDAVENEGTTLDVCSSHPAPRGNFHYHFWGACLVKDYGFWSDT